MGYTHYWYRKPRLDVAIFNAAVADCKKVCDASGVKLAGYNGFGEPTFDDGGISFNGDKHEGYETFAIEPVYFGRGGLDDNGHAFDFCKTAYRPYDLAVCACLIVFVHYFKPTHFIVSSDGRDEGFNAARELCQATLGYGSDFSIG